MIVGFGVAVILASLKKREPIEMPTPEITVVEAASAIIGPDGNLAEAFGIEMRGASFVR